MNTFLTKLDRKMLALDLEECLSELDYTESEVFDIIGDLHEQPNTVFYLTCVDFMPECMDDLQYRKERLQANQKTRLRD